MKIVLYEDPMYREQLKPLTLTRPIGMLRIGIYTIYEKWKKKLNVDISFETVSYLQKKYPLDKAENALYINASFLPTASLLACLKQLQVGEEICSNGEVIAYYNGSTAKKNIELDVESLRVVRKLPDLFLMNNLEIISDFNEAVKGRKSHPITDPYTRAYAKENIFIEEGVSFKCCILNAEDGPIYIGKNAIIQEGAIIIGPTAIGAESKVAYGAKIRGNTTLGPGSRVGGEVGNSIFYGNSNKAHDGFLANSYIGEWCNLGANTNNSNLKNDYSPVKLYDYAKNSLHNTEELFCGTFMGDYSKLGISTMLNTGTVIGVSCNVFGSGFQDKFVRSFSWGGNQDGYTTYRFEKAIEVINATIGRKAEKLDKIDEDILEHILLNRKEE